MGNSKLMHIEGLRGLAIILVILFHSFPDILPNGFVGVDVFFVIAGYLLFRKPLFSTDKGGTWETCKVFIQKKVARILQPLAFVVLLTLLCGYFFLTPEDSMSGAKTGIYALLCTSSQYLDSMNDSYFGADSGYNPLVHTWYVSVLCQLFLLFLLGSLILRNKTRKTVYITLSALGLLSFIAFHEQLITSSLTYYVLDYKDCYANFPSFSYYSTFGRVWEILAGGCVALLPRCTNRKLPLIASIAGLTLLVFSTIGLPKDSLGPFYRIIRYLSSDCAVVATVLLLAYGASGPVSKFLTMRVWILLGTISFSLYLVHMPIVIAWRSMISIDTLLLRCAVLATVAVAAIAFYYLVERRKFSGITAWIAWGVALGASLFVGNTTPHLSHWDNARLTYRAHKHALQYCEGEYMQGYDTNILSRTTMVSSMAASSARCTPHLLYLGDSTQKPGFVLMGDSHAASLFYGLDDLCHEEALCGVYTSTYVIPAHNYRDGRTVGFQSWYPAKEKALMDWLACHPEIKTVILSGIWEGLINRLQEDTIKQFIRCIHESGRQVIVTQPIPVLEDKTNYRRTYRLFKERGLKNLDGFSITYDEYLLNTERTRELFKELESEGTCHVLPISNAMFHNGVFTAFDNGQLLMCDSNHFSPEGSHRAIYSCREQLLEWLGKGQAENEEGKTE